MDAVAELRLLLGSGTSLITVDTAEEPRALRIVRDASGSTPVWTWSSASGLSRDGSAAIYGSVDPDQMLSNLLAMTGPWTCVLCDPSPVLGDAVALRQLKEIGQRAIPGQTLLLVGHAMTIPPDLEGVARPWRLGPPSIAELTTLVDRVAVRLGQRNVVVELGDLDRLRLARSLAGLTLVEAERQLMQVALADGRLDAGDIATALAGKAALLNTNGVLEIVVDDTVRLEDLGGLTELKAWLAPRVHAGLDRAADPPRGVLLAGVPGCGKSAVAHAIAAAWSVPLVLLDPGRIYRKFVGESEQRFDDALASVEMMAPAVLWIDEIEKGLSTGSEDGGVSGRVLATFLRWLQDHDAPVFVVATANDVTRLPPELTRKGRFDELFFVDLPAAPARVEILRSLLARRSVTFTDTEVEDLATQTDGFSGAELDAAVVAASYAGAITAASVRHELASTVPLSRSRAAEVAALRAWAHDHARIA